MATLNIHFPSLREPALEHHGCITGRLLNFANTPFWCENFGFWQSSHSVYYHSRADPDEWRVPAELFMWDCDGVYNNVLVAHSAHFTWIDRKSLRLRHSEFRIQTFMFLRSTCVSCQWAVIKLYCEENWLAGKKASQFRSSFLLSEMITVFWRCVLKGNIEGTVVMPTNMDPTGLSL